MKLAKKHILIVLVLFITIIFLAIKMILNHNGYEFLSWVYYAISFYIICSIILETIFVILQKRMPRIEKIFVSIIAILTETIIFLVILFLAFLKFNIHNERIIEINHEMYIESYDFFEIHPTPDYYEYINVFIRKKEATEYNIEL